MRETARRTALQANSVASADRELKKSIKRVQNELESLGLDAAILKELLHAGADNHGTDEAEHAEDEASFLLIGSHEGQHATKRRKLRPQRAQAAYELAGQLLT